MVKKLMKNFMGLMVGIPLVSAAASQVNAMPAGTAKDFSGTAVGLSGVALMGHALKGIPKPKLKRSKMKW